MSEGSERTRVVKGRNLAFVKGQHEMEPVARRFLRASVDAWHEPTLKYPIHDSDVYDAAGTALHLVRMNLFVRLTKRSLQLIVEE